MQLAVWLLIGYSGQELFWEKKMKHYFTRMRSYKHALVFSIAIALFLPIVTQAFAFKRLNEGDTAIDYELKDTNGVPFKLSHFKGSVILTAFIKNPSLRCGKNAGAYAKAFRPVRRIPRPYGPGRLCAPAGRYYTAGRIGRP